MSKKYRIGKFLDASTDQVTEEDLEVLARMEEGVVPSDGPRVIPHQYGWWINVQHDDKDSREDAIQGITDNGLSAEFLALFQSAVAEKCDWINLDRDA